MNGAVQGEQAPIPLTKRQVEVLILLREGKSDEQIADLLLLREKTVRWHITNISHALGVSGRGAICRCAESLGLLPLPVM